MVQGRSSDGIKGQPEVVKSQSIKWVCPRKHSGTIHRTSLEVKDFTQRPVDYISIDLDYRSLQKDYKKSGQKVTRWPAAPSIKCGWTWKHSGILHRSPLEVKDFSPTPIDYKTIDLNYRSLQKDYKKAVQRSKDGLQHHQ
jgi:hypothetical protein